MPYPYNNRTKVPVNLSSTQKFLPLASSRPIRHDAYLMYQRKLNFTIRDAFSHPLTPSSAPPEKKIFGYHIQAREEIKLERQT